MDQSLLEQRQPPPTVAEDPTNAAGVLPPDTVLNANGQIEFRELEVPSPMLPLRMRLNPPLEFDGQNYSTLVFDFDAMNGKDFLRAEREFNRLYKPDKDEMVLPEMKHLYHQIIAAHRANVPLGVIQKLPRRYYTPLRVEVLKACGSSLDEEKA